MDTTSGTILHLNNIVNLSDSAQTSTYCDHNIQLNIPFVIPRHAAEITLRKLIFKNCNTSFKVNNFSIIIDDHVFENIYINDLLQIHPDLKESLTIDGAEYVIYHLDKLAMKLNYHIVSIPYNVFKLCVYTEGTCESSVVNCKYINYCSRIRLSLGEYHRVPYKTFIISEKIDICNAQPIYISGKHQCNGYIITGFTDINNINSILLNLGANARINYNNKVSIRTNCTIINNHTLYIPFNDKSYDADITPNDMFNIYNGIGTTVSLSIGLDHLLTPERIQIATFTNDIHVYTNGFILNNNINSINISTININRPSSVVTWSKNTQILEGNTECPVSLCPISDEYVKCKQCKINLCVDVAHNWIKKHQNCPHCRSIWHNYIIYTIPYES